MESLGKVAPGCLIVNVARELLDASFHQVAKRVGVVFATGEADDARVFRQPLFSIGVVQGREELASRQIAGSAKDNDARGFSVHDNAPRPGKAQSSVFTACPPN